MYLNAYDHSIKVKANKVLIIVLKMDFNITNYHIKIYFYQTPFFTKGNFTT